MPHPKWMTQKHSDKRFCRKCKIERVSELDKCVAVCKNCHAELHYRGDVNGS